MSSQNFKVGDLVRLTDDALSLRSRWAKDFAGSGIFLGTKTNELIPGSFVTWAKILLMNGTIETPYLEDLEKI